MFKGSQEYVRFSSAIRSALGVETEHYDLGQLCELCVLMAKDGDDAAGVALRTRVLGQPLAGWDTFGWHELIALDGISAIVELARGFGRWLIANPGEDVPPLDYLTDEPSTLSQAKLKLNELAETDAAIKAYLDDYLAATSPKNTPELTNEQRQEQRRERIRNEYQLNKILGDASAGVGEYAGRYMQFGRFATDEELREVMRRLIEETDEKALLRLLWVFRRAQLPDLAPRFWTLAESKNKAIREAAIGALAQSCDPRIGDLGRVKLHSQDFSEDDSEVLGLFILNYQPQDELLIMSALARLSPNDDHAHSFGSDILKVIEKSDSPAFVGLARWVYETTPCTICRYAAVEWMANNGGIPPEIASECLHDAEEDTRKIAGQVMVA